MILFTLVVMAGLAVDVGNWWWTGQKVQKAADAAAMAGVSYMPEDLNASGSQAKALAQTIASRNGYTNGSNANVVVAGSSKPTELRVTIDTDVNNFFTGILGFKKTNIKRTAVADYSGSVPSRLPRSGPRDTGPLAEAVAQRVRPRIHEGLGRPLHVAHVRVEHLRVLR
jgi:Flp pilus assembly protein TadG